MFNITDIFVYPVKSLPGISLNTAEINEKGILHDREWMLVDSNNRFITQRKHSKMVHCHVKLTKDSLAISFDKEEFSVPFDEFHKQDRATVWTDEVTVLKIDSIINEAFSDFLGIQCELVKTSESTKRKEIYNNGNVRFSDQYPVLFANKASLDFLNSKFSRKISMQNFRPNIVFEGSLPFEEESWVTFRVGDVHFQTGEPCKRCVMININQQTGIEYKENFTSLKKIRGPQNAVFGLLASPLTSGSVKINDIIQVL